MKIKRIIIAIITSLVIVSLTGMPAFAISETDNNTGNTQLSGAVEYITKEITNLTEYVGSEWAIKALADTRLGNVAIDTISAVYLNNLKSHLKECNGVLSEDSYTEYSRVVITLSSLGIDAADVDGYNLVKPLSMIHKVNYQGINGPIYALMALDSGNYDGPRERYVSYILKKQSDKGGWTYFGDKADPDITAAAIRALQPYESKPEVKEAIERGLSSLSPSALDNCESVAQVILMYDAMGEKADDALVGKLMSFQMKDGSFRHSMDDEQGNIMSTEQALMALSKIYF